MNLAANGDVVTHADAGGRIARASRRDVFDTLSARGGLSRDALEAVRRLQADIARLHAGGGGVAAYGERIDRRPNREGYTDARHAAGGRIGDVLALAGPASAHLLVAILESEVAMGQPAQWRRIVERETGETLADAQAAVLRAACENLSGAFALFDRRRRPQTS